MILSDLVMVKMSHLVPMDDVLVTLTDSMLEQVLVHLLVHWMDLLWIL